MIVARRTRHKLRRTRRMEPSDSISRTHGNDAHTLVEAESDAVPERRTCIPE